MERGDIFSLTIKEVRLHKEERMIQGDMYGSYTSNYVASFKEFPNGIAVVDAIAMTKHPEWKKKTDNRSSLLSKELTGLKVSVKVTDVFAGNNCFVAEIV